MTNENKEDTTEEEFKDPFENNDAAVSEDAKAAPGICESCEG